MPNIESSLRVSWIEDERIEEFQVINPPFRQVRLKQAENEEYISSSEQVPPAASVARQAPAHRGIARTEWT